MKLLTKEADQAGISRGLIFHYFPTKHDYYVAVLRGAADQLVEQTVTDSAGDVAERLAAGLRAYFRFVEERALAYATLLRAGGGDPDIQELVEATRRRFIDSIRGHIAPLVVADAALLRAGLRSWIGLVEALALDWIDHRDLTQEALVALATRAFALVVPGGLGLAT